MRRRNWWIWLVAALMVVCCVGVFLRLAQRRTIVCDQHCVPAQRLFLPVGGMSDIRTLDPANATDAESAQVAGIVFPGLIVLDKNLTPIPWATNALPNVSEDGLTWTFKIRPNLKWSDDTPITAETYAFSMNRAENPCNAFGAAYYLYAIKDAAAFNAEACDTAHMKPRGPIQTLLGDSITTPDPLTLRIRLTQPATYFLSAMTYPASYAVPEQLIQQYGAKWTDHLADGAGFGGDLFKLTKWDHQGHLVLSRNDSFWGVKPKLREVDFHFYKDASAAYQAFLAGQIDAGYAPADHLTIARGHKTFHQLPIQQIDYLAMNWHMAPFDDIRMRKAFAIALDKTALASAYTYGAAQATNHIIPEGMPGFNASLLGPDGTQSLSGNIALANALATQYAIAKKCGVSTDFSHCPPVALTLVTNSPLEDAAAQAAQATWEKAMPNYPITVGSCDFGCPPGLLSTTNPLSHYQFVNATWIEDYPDPQDWLSTNLMCASYYNIGGACDKQADALMKGADVNPDTAVRLTQYQQAEQILVTDVAWLPLDQQTIWWETGPRLQNFTIAATGLIPRESWQTMYISAG